MKNKKYWSSLVYIIFLTVFILSIWAIVVNKQVYFSNYFYYSNKKNQLNNSIDKKFDKYFNNFNDKILYWIVYNDYENIFWNNSKINLFLSWTSDLSSKELWLVSSWSLFIDIDGQYDLKIIKFDKNNFDYRQSLTKLEEIYLTWITSTWYLQQNLTFSSILSNYKFFDFSNNDYAVFIKPTNQNVILKYKLSIKDYSWKNVILNPIKNYSDRIEYLWYDIIFDKNNFFYNITKLVRFK